MIDLIELAFEEMVKGIEDTISETAIPSAYYNNESFAEINSVYQFVKSFELKEKSAIYLEYPCDSGRIDAVVVLENNIILIEAKRGMDPKKFKVLNAQAARFESNSIDFLNKEKWLQAYYEDNSLRGYLQKIQVFIKEKWKIEKPMELYGVLLADTNKEIQEKRWGDKNYYKSIQLETMMGDYTHQITKNKIHKNWTHLIAYKSLGVLN